MPIFSRDNPYHRSLVSANTPTARRNLGTPYVSFSVARATLSPRVTSSLLVTSAAPLGVFSPQSGVECQEVSLLTFARSKVGLTAVTCFDKLGELPPG